MRQLAASALVMVAALCAGCGGKESPRASRDSLDYAKMEAESKALGKKVMADVAKDMKDLQEDMRTLHEEQKKALREVADSTLSSLKDAANDKVESELEQRFNRWHEQVLDAEGQWERDERLQAVRENHKLQAGIAAYQVNQGQLRRRRDAITQAASDRMKAAQKTARERLMAAADEKGLKKVEKEGLTSLRDEFHKQLDADLAQFKKEYDTARDRVLAVSASVQSVATADVAKRQAVRYAKDESPRVGMPQAGPAKTTTVQSAKKEQLNEKDSESARLKTVPGAIAAGAPQSARSVAGAAKKATQRPDPTVSSTEKPEVVALFKQGQVYQKGDGVG